MWLLNTPGFLHFSQQSLPEEEAYFQNSSYHEATSQSGTLTHPSSLAGRHTVQRFAAWELEVHCVQTLQASCQADKPPPRAAHSLARGGPGLDPQVGVDREWARTLRTRGRVGVHVQVSASVFSAALDSYK